METIKGTWVFNEIINMPAELDTVGEDLDILINHELYDSGGTYHTNGYRLRFSYNTSDRTKYLICMCSDNFSYSVYSDGWDNELSRTMTFLDEPTSEAFDFATWLQANATKQGEEPDTPGTTITYDGGTIAAVAAGGTATLKCAGLKMKTDITIKAAEGGGSFEINGLLREYKVNAGANVSAGDFVEFVTRFGNGRWGGETEFSSASFCMLDDNRVVFAYTDSETTYGMAVIFSVNNNEIVMGEPIVFSSENTSYIRLTYFSGDKVVVTYNGVNAKTASARILTISETLISIGDALTYFTGNNYSSPRHSHVIVLDSTTILMSFWSQGSGTTADWATAYLMRISDTTIQMVTSVTVDSSYRYVVAEKLSADRVIFVGVRKSDNYTLVFFVNISGDTLTAVEGPLFNFKADYSSYSPALWTKKINDNAILLIYNNSAYQKARMLTVNGDEVEVGAEYSINTSSCPRDYDLLSANKILCVYADAGDSSLCKAKVLTINEDNTITVGDPSTLNNVAVSNISVMTFSETSALIMFYDGYRSYSSLTIDGTTVTNDSFTVGTYVQPATSSLHNIGVAKTGGAAGETVEVYCVGGTE